MNRLTQVEFINSAILIHNNKYDYSLVKYVNILTYVDIICLTHGIFKQKPKHHLRGKGCSACCGINKTTPQFIIEAKLIHGDNYDYSIVEYINATSKIKIKCNIHGIFEQSPNSHLSGKGCPICRESKGEKKITSYLEDNKILFIKQYKFKNCMNKYKLPFDFYLPNFNICIEYDGEQHYKPMRFNNAINKFNSTVKNDIIKTKFCSLNNITLIRIKYTEDINNVLKKYFP